MIRALTRYLRALLTGASDLVVLVGPDGSGKSTLAFTVGERYEAAAYPMQRAPLRWRVLNRRLLDRNASLRAAMLARGPGPVRRALGAVTHSLEYLEQHVRLARILAGPQTLTVTDGYVWEPVIRWRRRSAPTFFWWTLLLARAFPTPRLVVLCGGDPNAIWVRKPDMREAEVRATLRQYRALLRALRIPFVEIDTTSVPIDASVRCVAALADLERNGEMETQLKEAAACV